MDRDQAHLAELGHRLWAEREVVTQLLYRLTVTKLLLAADERRFVAAAFDEVEQTVTRLRDGELARDRAVRDLAERWQVDPRQLTLAELARLSPPPFDHTFGEHRDAFQRLAAEIEDLAHQNRALAANELDEIRTTLDLLAGEDHTATATYDAHGQLDTAGRVGSVLREVL